LFFFVFPFLRFFFFFFFLTYRELRCFILCNYSSAGRKTLRCPYALLERSRQSNTGISNTRIFSIASHGFPAEEAADPCVLSLPVMSRSLHAIPFLDLDLIILFVGLPGLWLPFVVVRHDCRVVTWWSRRRYVRRVRRGELAWTLVLGLGGGRGRVDGKAALATTTLSASATAALAACFLLASATHGRCRWAAVGYFANRSEADR